MSSNHHYELLCLENPLLDIQAPGSVQQPMPSILLPSDTGQTG